MKAKAPTVVFILIYEGKANAIAPAPKKSARNWLGHPTRNQNPEARLCSRAVRRTAVVRGEERSGRVTRAPPFIWMPQVRRHDRDIF